MNKILLCIILVAIAPLLIVKGCAYQEEHALLSGVIIDKEYSPASGYYNTYYIQIGDLSVPQMQYIEVPECYSVTFQGRNKYNELKTREIEVSNQKWQNCTIGSAISLK